jgi:tetratricopeptide (TPR) repeat protein
MTTSSSTVRRCRLPVVALVGALFVIGCGSSVGAAPLAVAHPSVAPSASVASTTSPPSSAPSSVAPTSPPAMSKAAADVVRLEAAIAANPRDEGSQRDLGLALLQRVRETADPRLYAPAADALEAARALAPDDAVVFVGIGGLQLGKHQFAEALVTGRTASALSPNLAAARAVVVDALVELGRYDEADAAAKAMLGLSTDQSTFARVSYLAELHGDLPAALTAMRLAARSPGVATENFAYIEALLGNLLVYTGDPTAAAKTYAAALHLVPGHAPSLAGEGRLAVGAGHLDEAIGLFQHASDIVPLPEYVIALGDAQAAAGHSDDATRSFKLARAEIQLFQASGVTVDLDLALFEADHGDPARALDFAKAAYKATPTVRAADALAWALHHLGRDKEARKSSDEALRLGSRDPLFRYHAGVIAAALGDAKTARADLEMALSTDPGFSATGAAEARRILAALPG